MEGQVLIRMASVLWWMKTPMGPWSGSTPGAVHSARSMGSLRRFPPRNAWTPQCPPPGLAWVRASIPTTVTLMSRCDRCPSWLLPAISLMSWSMYSPVPSITPPVSRPQPRRGWPRCQAWRQTCRPAGIASATHRHRPAERRRLAWSSRRARSRCPRRCRPPRPSANRAPGPRRW